jgi:hypothetical protein
MIEKFLEEKEDKCATTNDIINYVKSQREASEKSIRRYLEDKKANKNKTIRI